MIQGITKKAVVDMDKSRKEKITLRKRGQITLPKQMLDELDLREGETLEIRLENGKMVIVPTIAVAKDQAWFWNDHWQREEREAEKQIQEGRISKPMDVDEAIQFLDRLKG